VDFLVKTFVQKEADVKRLWFIVDAADKTLGRLAVKIANLLRGKTKPTYTPQVDCGDFVVVINAEKVKLTGSKETQKTYSHFSGYRSGEYTLTAAAVRATHPERIIESAVHGMLPRNRSLSRAAFKRLKVYAGTNHPHAAQNPKVVDLK
jgi:large subunit ribosomal protein L13